MNYTRKVSWRSERATKKARIAKEEYNEQERRYYSHTHTTERVIEQLEDQIYVVIDIDAIVDDIARRAAQNNSGRAIALGGQITGMSVDDLRDEYESDDEEEDDNG